MTDMILHSFGDPARAKTVLLPSSGSWLQDAQAATRIRRQSKKRAEGVAEADRHYRGEMRRLALEALDAGTVEVPEALFDALMDHFHLGDWEVPASSSEIINAYLEERDGHH